MSKEKQLPTSQQSLPPLPRLVQYGVPRALSPHSAAIGSGSQLDISQDHRWEIARQRQLAQSFHLLERARCLAGKSVAAEGESTQDTTDQKHAGPTAKRARTDDAKIGDSRRGPEANASAAMSANFVTGARGAPLGPVVAGAAPGGAETVSGLSNSGDGEPAERAAQVVMDADGAATSSGLPIPVDLKDSAALELVPSASSEPKTAKVERTSVSSISVVNKPHPYTAKVSKSEDSSLSVEPCEVQNGSAIRGVIPTSPYNDEFISTVTTDINETPCRAIEADADSSTNAESDGGLGELSHMDSKILSVSHSAPESLFVKTRSKAAFLADDSIVDPAVTHTKEDNHHLRKVSATDVSSEPIPSPSCSPSPKLKQAWLRRMPSESECGADVEEPREVQPAADSVQISRYKLAVLTGQKDSERISAHPVEAVMKKELCEGLMSSDKADSLQFDRHVKEAKQPKTLLQESDAVADLKRELPDRDAERTTSLSKCELSNPEGWGVMKTSFESEAKKTDVEKRISESITHAETIPCIKSEPMELAPPENNMDQSSTKTSLGAIKTEPVLPVARPDSDCASADSSAANRESLSETCPSEIEKVLPTIDTKTPTDPGDIGEPPVKKRKPGRPRKHPLKVEPQEPRLSYSLLKKTGQSFLQHQFCCKIQAKLPRCRECRAVAPTRSKHPAGMFCRFTSFRRLRYTRTGQLNVSGFCDPVCDAAGADSERLWRAQLDGSSTMSLPTATFLLQHVSRQFCELVQDEETARQEHQECQKARLSQQGEDVDDRPRPIAWKRVVHGFREMCDVCETTLFNYHWVCSLCGFAVCVDCFRGRRDRTAKVWGESAPERDGYRWLLCGGKRREHCPDKLMLTQIVAGDALSVLNRQVHEARRVVGLANCDCDSEKCVTVDGAGDPAASSAATVASTNTAVDEAVSTSLSQLGQPAGSPLALLADVALSRSHISSDDDSDTDSDEGGCGSSLRRLLVTVTNSEQLSKPKPAVKKERGPRSGLSWMDEVLDKVQSQSAPQLPGSSMLSGASAPLRHFVRRGSSRRDFRERLPIRLMTLVESRRLYPSVRHSWLCDGKLLRLHDTQSEDGQRLFKDQWARGQPVLVSAIGGNLRADIWSVDAFIRDFGEIRNDLINCMTGNTVPNQPMRRFWEGFECVARRLRDERGQPMVLKLKDWPPGEDFADMMPLRFGDLMSVLPMTDYTLRDGRLNLASCLPDTFVRPDLGPKMYIAYGCALHPSKASTNLHLDVSDAVNIMVHVGIPRDGDANNEEALRAINEAGCDQLTKRRVKDELPGALWHIYHAADADKIRDLLNKVAIERGDQLEPHHDPIHDQSWYLDGPLRRRLYNEYAVEGYPIVQCAGDAVFIPAGAPHQVRNLHSCIKVAEDFVSPENIGHCFDLTQEFRSLSDTHTNHEDKLQIKNIIFHAMKEAVGCILGSKSKEENTDVKPKKTVP